MNLTQKSHLLLLVYQEIMIHILFLVFAYFVFILAFTQEKIVISRSSTQSPSWSMWRVTRAVVATSLLSARVRLECRGSGETCDVLLTREYFAKNLYDNILIMFSYFLL